MKKQHTKPCSDCPWRRKALPGWVGAKLTPEDWCEAAHSDALVHCHKANFETQCAGAAIFRANVCKVPRDRTALRLEPDTKIVFETDAQMIAHHRKHGKTSAEIGR